MKKQSPKSSSKSGQSMIEFSLVAVIFIFMLSLTFNAILAFSVQQYMSYAAFMTARALQAGGEDPATQFQSAARTLASFVPNLQVNGPQQEGVEVPFRFGGFSKNLAVITGYTIPPPQGFDYGQASPTSVSVEIRFKVPFVEIAIGGQLRERFGTIPLSASSYLGREVSRAECKAFFQSFMQTFSISGPVTAAYNNFAGQYYTSMEDNGC